MRRLWNSKQTVIIDWFIISKNWCVAFLFWYKKSQGTLHSLLLDPSHEVCRRAFKTFLCFNILQRCLYSIHEVDFLSWTDIIYCLGSKIKSHNSINKILMHYSIHNLHAKVLKDVYNWFIIEKKKKNNVLINFLILGFLSKIFKIDN